MSAHRRRKRAYRRLEAIDRAGGHPLTHGIRRLARTLSHGDREVANDLVQEGLIALWENVEYLAKRQDPTPHGLHLARQRMVKYLYTQVLRPQLTVLRLAGEAGEVVQGREPKKRRRAA